ncbi:MAG: ferritin-like domain-containing protein [Bryobacterales bacterium]|nr:ferritin-like domain-containing protein [Bryobacterales bacterium]
MTDSRRWLLYFRDNQNEPTEIPWPLATPRQDALGSDIVRSIQQFQLGENASGRHFLDLARQHGRATGDADFPEAIALFIAEEQRHSALLGRYLRVAGAACLQQHWIHSAFRWLRHVGGLEAKVTVLVVAEMLAVPYYRALMEVARCPALEAICQRILCEEAQHLLFQGNTLRRLQGRRPRTYVKLVHFAQELLLAGTSLATWWEHRRIFAAAGDGFLDVWYTARVVLAHVQHAASSGNPLAYGVGTPAAGGATTRMPVSQ